MGNVLIMPKQSKEFVQGLFESLGVEANAAEIVADHLTQAEMRGLASHGLSRIPFYTAKLRGGGYKAAPHMCIVRESESCALLDADDALGAVAGRQAMELAMVKARQSGCGTVAVCHCNHIGFLAYYTMMAAQQGMVGLALCNSGASTAVWGTRQRVLGTNPLSVCLPAQRHDCVVFDGATSVVAQGKVAVANIEGRPIPSSWAYGPGGEPTADAALALQGAMCPAGGYKGSGLAMVISLLCAGLTDMPFDMEAENLRRIHEDSQGSELGAFFSAVDIGRFTSLNSFTRRVDGFINAVKAFPPAPGFEEILVPGEIEARSARRAETEGFTISCQLYDLLRTVAAPYGLDAQMAAWRHLR